MFLEHSYYIVFLPLARGTWSLNYLGYNPQEPKFRIKVDAGCGCSCQTPDDSRLSPARLYLSLQVADLKRANNLLTEQDFFALRSLKIPVRRFSIFTETHNAGAAKTGSPSSSRRLPQIAAVTSLPTESSTDSSSSDSVEGFLLEKDKDIEQLVRSTGPSRSSLNEVVSSLTQQQPLLVGEVEYKPLVRKDPYYGADWGMRWWTAVAIMLVVGIVTPVFYLLYYEVLIKTDASHHGVPTPPPGPQHNLEPQVEKDVQAPSEVNGNGVNEADGHQPGPGEDDAVGEPRAVLKNT